MIIVGMLVAVLTGCTSSAKSTYNNVEELRVAFEAAGGSCPQWTQDNAVDDARESGNCGSQTVLMVFNTQEEAETRAGVLEQMLSAFEMDVNLLVGENWLVNSPDASLVEPTLGGSLVIE